MREWENDGVRGVRRSITPTLGPIVATVAALAAAQWISDVAPIDAVRIAVVVAMQWWSGIVVLRAAWPTASLTSLERGSLGAVTGMSLALVADQVVLGTVGAGWGWVVPVGVALAIRIRRDDAVDRPVLRDGLWILVATALMLGAGWYWPMPVAICGAAWLLTTEPGVAARIGRRAARVVRIAAIVGAAPALGWGLATRPTTWWIEDSDYGFFEAIGRAFAHDGIAANPIAAGYPIRYHWLVYGWFGLLERVTGAPNWVVMSRSGLLLGTIVVVAVLLALLRRLVASQSAAVVALLGIAVFDTFTAWGSGFRLGLVSAASQMVGFAWLFALGLLLVLRTRTGLGTWPLTGLLMACATGAKISHGVVAGAGLGIAAVAGAVRERRFASRLAPDACAAAAGFLVAFVVVHLGAGNLRLATMRFPLSLQGELVDYPGRPTHLAGIVMLTGLVGLAALAPAATVLARRGTADPYAWYALGAIVAGLVVSVVTESVFGSQLYFAHSAAAVALPLVAARIAEHPGPPWPGRVVMSLVAGAGIVAAVATRAIPSLDSGSGTAILLRLARGATWIVPLGVVLVLAAVGAVRRGAVVRTLLAGLAIAGVATGLVNWFESVRTRYPAVLEVDPPSRIGAPDLRDATAWIRSETPGDAVIASNDGNFLPATLSRRSALLLREDLAARHTRPSPERDAEFEERKLLQRDFAAAPTEALRERLVAKGVGWFLVRLEPGAEWTSDVGTVRYRNATYVVVDLTDRPAGS
ncbi:MAG: hypothetical protein RL283_750 [Actinomycetota bacterium]